MKKEIDGNTVKDIRNIFRLKKKEIKDTLNRDIMNLFEHEEDYYKSNNDENKTVK